MTRRGDEEAPRGRRRRETRETVTWMARWEIRTTWPFFSASQVERRFEELIRRRWGASESEPPADVFLVGDEIWVEVDLPGVEPGEVQARLEGGALLIEAARRPVPPAEQARAAAVERRRGRIRRRIPLPLDVGAARVEWRLEAGVLRVRIRPRGRS